MKQFAEILFMEPSVLRQIRLHRWLATILMFASATCLPSLNGQLVAQEESGPLLEECLTTNRHLMAPAENDSIQAADSATERLFRPVLHSESGMKLEPVYYGEVLTNTRGGLSTNDATKFAGLLDLAATFDFDAMQLPLPGRFFLLGQNSHGRGLTESFVGDTQTVSNIDSFDNIMQVSEYWWEFPLFDQNVAVRLGKQDVNTEFLVMDSASDFIQSSFGLSPSAGFPSYPAPSMAAVLLADFTDSMTLKIGIWDALADGGSWGFSGNDVTLTFGELEYQYALDNGQLPGALDLGIGYQSDGEVSPGEFLASGYGYYIQIEQLVFRENPSCEEDMQGLGVFCSYFPRFANGPIPTSSIETAFVCGAVCRGLIPHRDQDVVGAGYAWAGLKQGGTNEETVIEVFYKTQLNSRMMLQPDLQYVASPSGIHPDALAVGLRVELAL